MINTHVTSLELSKKLKELGVKQESIFSHIDYGGKYNVYPTDLFIKKEGLDYVSAFLASELGEMLPDSLFECFDICIVKNESKYHIAYSRIIMGEDADVEAEADDSNLADALAKMLIYLLENNLLSVNDVNK